VKRLIADGLMTPAGAVHIPTPKAAKAYHAKHAKRTTGTTVAPRDMSAALAKNAKAKAFWATLAPGYRRTWIRVITDAKRPETRVRRIAKVVDLFARGIKIPLG
jgi:uncharacterized protein YdeI (YjbR/CyaY-like superfamily)